MPGEREWSGLHVSVSQIKCYLRCPRQYQLKYVLGVEPAFVPAALAFGSAFHVALGYFYGLLKEAGSAPGPGELAEVFRDAWDNAASGPVPLQVEDEEDAAADPVARGTAMLAAFHREAAARPVQVESVERGFAVGLHDPDTGEVLEEKLVGALDLVVWDGERRVVVEHKTAARRYSQDQLRYDLQPTAYKLAAAQLGLGEVGVRLQVVTKTKEPAVQVEEVERGGRDVDDFLRTVVGVLRAVDVGAFYPVRGWQCRGCPYGHACVATEP